MRFEQSWSSGASPAALRAAAVDVRRRRVIDAAVVTSGDDGVPVVTAVSPVPTGAKGFAAAIVGDTLVVRRTERWSPVGDDGGVRLEVEVVVDDKPFRVTATIDLVPAGGGTRCRLSGRATVKLPGVGGLIEKKLAAETVRGLRDGLEQLPARAA